MLQSAALASVPGVRHAFFTRDGGVSDGLYTQPQWRNRLERCPGRVVENRARMAAALGVAPDSFLTAYQIHSPDVVTIDRPWTARGAPARRCDRDADARDRHRRHDGGLRPGAVRGRAGAA